MAACGNDDIARVWTSRTMLHPCPRGCCMLLRIIISVQGLLRGGQLSKPVAMQVFAMYERQLDDFLKPTLLWAQSFDPFAVPK